MGNYFLMIYLLTSEIIHTQKFISWINQITKIIDICIYVYVERRITNKSNNSVNENYYVL